MGLPNEEAVQAEGTFRGSWDHCSVRFQHLGFLQETGQFLILHASCKVLGFVGAYKTAKTDESRKLSTPRPRLFGLVYKRAVGLKAPPACHQSQQGAKPSFTVSKPTHTT